MPINPYFKGGGDVPILDGGTGASTASGARSNLMALDETAHDLLDHTGLTGVGDLTTAAHASVDHSVVPATFFNIGAATSAVANGDLAAGDGVRELFYDANIGSLALTGSFGESNTTRYATTTVDFSVSGTASGLIPAGALVIAVTTRVLTTISGGGATDYEVGDGVDTNRWGNGGALTPGTTTDPTTYGDNTIQFNNTASAADVVLTGVGGSPTAGTVRVTLAYMSFTAPTS